VETQEKAGVILPTTIECLSKPPPLVSDVPSPVIPASPISQQRVGQLQLDSDIPSFESLIKTEEFNREPVIVEKDHELDRLLTEIADSFTNEQSNEVSVQQQLKEDVHGSYSSENCVFSPDMVQTFEHFEDIDMCDTSRLLLSAASGFERTRSKIVDMPTGEEPFSPATSDLGYESGNSPISSESFASHVPSACHAFDLFPQLK